MGAVQERWATVATTRWAAVLGTALALRLALIAYADWHDEHVVVKYTDVDYHVFTDAAAAVAKGDSPFARRTYRYTPLLAWALVPNVLGFRAFGKVLFALCDLGVGQTLVQILCRQKLPAATAKAWACLWLFHPYSVNISTRGNADAVVCLLVLRAGLGALEDRWVQAALFYGLAVHVRIFPIVFAPAFLLCIGWQQPRKLFTFAFVSGGIFLALAAFFYALYGFTFAYETYLYHLVRTDNRHNFSVYFYSLYLQYGAPAGFVMGLAAFLPQLVAQGALVAALHRREDLIACMCLQTMAFVAFNKVCTAQYFTWYTALIPVPLSTLRAQGRLSLSVVVGAALVWLFAQGAWLAQAYLLEFKARNTFFRIWLAGIAFFVVNLGIIAALARALVRSK
ncbi:GPI mannosyltransferase 1 [Hondaea fermentalgiana]|uniref:GPI mannosyltransferase 1 n=1 Tax=Hondaea fermentalgiana TaxID=2315210 RepID=A0A2R5G7D0_9STRA|nr:GPI mannosyltransferase 1 [Hondaea fermentalgiana]|eukprot:GBG26966.1 GPI mannosyltransferase 1 [Hondaea fermentalgiana]